MSVPIRRFVNVNVAFANFVDGESVGNESIDTNGNLYEWHGPALGWVQTHSGGSAHVYGLARNAIRVSSGTYNTTEIYGFRILVAGTGTLTLSPIGGGTDIVITAAEITAMGVNAFVDWPLHCDSITLGNADMEVLVYTP